MRRLTALAIFLLIIADAFAQEQSCPAMQRQAAASIAEHCADQAAGTLCFGQATVTPVLRQSAANPASVFQPGAALALADIDWLSVSSEDQTWGMARALFPAYPDDGFEPLETALLAFGNVALFLPDALDSPPSLADLRVTAAQGANLRDMPTREAGVITQLPAQRSLKAIGRSGDANWLLVYDKPQRRGWISQSVVSLPELELPIMEAADAPPSLWLPSQRFDFRSGMKDAPCAAAPQSGILLQTPKAGSPIAFIINGARLRLSGTAWLQAQISGGLHVHLMDGGGRLSTAQGEADLDPGRFSAVALERNDNGGLTPAAAPSPPAAYAYHDLINLPVAALPQGTRVALDRFALVDAPPAGGGSPLETLAPDAPCRLSATRSGANMRSKPDPDSPVIAVMAHRESAEPIARGIGGDSLPWWKLADSVWVRVDVTVAGGNCNDVPLVRVSA